MMKKNDLNFLHSFALLTKHQVYVMLYLFEYGCGGYTDIANEYNTTPGNVYNAGKVLVENHVVIYADKKFKIANDWRENLVKWKLTTTTE